MKGLIVASIVLTAGAAFVSHAGGVISVNMTASGGKTVSGSGSFGIVPAVGDTWRNVTETGGTEEPQHFTVTVDRETRDGAASDLASAVNVTFATDATDSPFQRYYQAGISGADDAFMYNYLNDNGNITVDVANVPYKAYKVILYMGADWAGAVGGWDPSGPDFNPIKVNGSFYRYSDEARCAVVCGSGAESCWGTYGSGTAEEGRNVLVTPTLYGSPLQLYVPRSYHPRRSALAAFQIVEAEGELKPVPAAISVNFVDASHDGETHQWRDTRVPQIGSFSDLSGGWIRAESWNNIEPTLDPDMNPVVGSQVLKLWDGGTQTVVATNDSKVAVSWNARGTYYDDKRWEHGTEPEDLFLYGFLADDTTPEVKVTGIPYEEYDLIVYAAADWGGETYGSWTGPDFNPVNVNGTLYTWSETEKKAVKTTDSGAYWGLFDQSKAAYGVNALRITGLTGSELSLNIGTRWRRGGIAAFQIVKPMPADLVAEDSIAAKDVNAAVRALHKEGAEFSLELPAGKALVLDEQNPLVCSRLKVTGKGNVLVDTLRDPLDEKGALLGWAAAELQKLDISSVRGAVFHGWKLTGRVISVNVYSEKGAMASSDGFAGAFAGEEIPASSWNDMPFELPSGSSFSPKVWNGVALSSGPVDGLTMDWDFVNAYGWGDSPDLYRRGWLTQGDRDWVISLAGIPFAKYDVICYFNWDGVAPFWANKINGVYYIGDENGVAQVSAYDGTWGMSGHSEAAQMGVNAYRLNDQTSPTLTLSGAWMANLCAVQIVEHAKKRRYVKPGLVVTIR